MSGLQKTMFDCSTLNNDFSNLKITRKRKYEDISQPDEILSGSTSNSAMDNDSQSFEEGYNYK